MLSETIIQRLAKRFEAPLAEFYKRRIVFWHDEDGEFTDAIEELDLPRVPRTNHKISKDPRACDSC